MSDTPQEVNPGHEDRGLEDTRASDTSGDDGAESAAVSPSVRRLLRQYDIDIASVQGTGPDGRVRPGDVLAIVGNPQLTKHSNADTPPTLTDEARAPGTSRTISRRKTETHIGEAFATCVFTCNMSRVLTHRSRSGLSDISIACYVTKAAGLAASKLYHLKDEHGRTPLRVNLITTESEHGALLQNPGSASVEAIHDALQQPRDRNDADEIARLRLMHHGLPGSLIDLSPPLESEESGVLCLGGLQRTIGLANADGGEAPRIVMQCQLSLTYRPSALTTAQAARFVSDCVRILETWAVPARQSADPASGTEDPASDSENGSD